MSAAVRGLLAPFSVEITPRETTKLPPLSGLLDPGTAVYLTFLPNVPWEQTLDAVRWVAHDGMRPVPHIAARGVPDRATLGRMFGELAAEGVEDVLLIAGGMAPVGEFHETVQILDSGCLEEAGIRRVGVAGHPEGHPDVADDLLTWALAAKNRIARDRGLDMHLVTQFTFAAEPVVAWERRLRAMGNTLPIHVGLPGVTSPAKLIKFGLSCGVGPSLSVLRKQAGGVLKLATTAAYKPEDTLLDLAAASPPTHAACSPPPISSRSARSPRPPSGPTTCEPVTPRDQRGAHECPSRRTCGSPSPRRSSRSATSPRGWASDPISWSRTASTSPRSSCRRSTSWPTGPRAKYVVVSAVTPTPLGEGKTTTTVGLGQAFSHIGKRATVAIRQPSMGPTFGIKGGAAGGGYSQVVPMEILNLHLTGDFHAVTAAHNLLSAMVDNHLHQGNAADLDLHDITWRRVLDVNDRALRNIVVGLGGKLDGVPRQTGFDITAACEVMAIFALATLAGRRCGSGSAASSSATPRRARRSPPRRSAARARWRRSCATR